MGRKSMWFGALALPALVMTAAPLHAARAEAPPLAVAKPADARLLTVEITETGPGAGTKTVLRVALSDRGGGSLEAHDEASDVELRATKRDDDGRSALVDLLIRHSKRQDGRVVQTQVNVTRLLEVGKPAIMTTVERPSGGMKVVATLR